MRRLRKRRKRRWELVPQLRDERGYIYVELINALGEANRAYIHELVAQVHVANPLGLKRIKHKNGDKTDNRADNLEWY